MKRLRLVILLFAPATLLAQTAPTPADSAAQAAWAKSDWPAAARAYQALVARDSTRAQYRFRLGVALIGLGRHAEARPHLEAAERLGTPVGQAAFRLALVTASSSPDSSFAQLRRATSAGLSQLPVFAEAEPNLMRLTQDPRYREFLTAMDRNARPCMHDARYREFDFWLGTWDVRPTGQPTAPPARNIITKIDDGCVVHESWKAPGSVGQSFNIFDRTRGKWFQTWVDNSGGLHEYQGGIRDGAMVLEGESTVPGPSNARVRTRLSFTPSAQGVRQFSERTTDGGKTWQVNYDLFYTRVDSAPATLRELDARAGSPADLTDADRRAIQTLDSTFVAAWLRDDTTTVMATLSSDAVLMPAGRHPLDGHAAIRAFWWPTDGSHTTINTFVSRIDDIAGNRDLAYVRANDSLTYTYAKGNSRQTQSSRTMSLAVVARRPDGRWQTIRKMWGPLVVPPR